MIGTEGQSRITHPVLQSGPGSASFRYDDAEPSGL